MCNNKLVCSCARFFKEQTEKETFVVEMESSTEPSVIYMASQYVCPSCGAVTLLLGDVFIRKESEDFAETYNNLRLNKKAELHEVYV